MTEKRECPICHRWAYLERHHIYEGRGRRKISDRLWLTIDICPDCHRKIHERPREWDWLKEKTQRDFMEKHDWTEERWLDEFGRSWLKGE